MAATDLVMVILAGTWLFGIATNGGVDLALVHHFYGSKEKVFATAMHLAVVPSEALDRLRTTRRSELGETTVQTVLGLWEDDQTRAPLLALLRSAFTNEQAAKFVTAAVLAPIAAVADQTEAGYRASLVGSQLIGVGIARYVIGVEPLASATTDEVIAAIGPTVQRHLVGRI